MRENKIETKFIVFNFDTNPKFPKQKIKKKKIKMRKEKKIFRVYCLKL